eukprot:gb/GECH01003158.1/.p1 GENE.gb/GECH01003158.1/~~gb/GECH01003158.1/.p1  ORF type:complete len:166 (+),score=23.14 gb/GECH01003158.1/:1-498(+)
MTRPEIVLSVFGSTGVGKSCMTVQFVQKRFMKEHDPTIEDQYTVIRKVEDEEVSLNIYDTAGQEEFVGLRAHYMKGTDGHMLVYSIVDEESLDEISKIHQQIIRATDCPDIPVLVVGNKVNTVYSPLFYFPAAMQFYFVFIILSAANRVYLASFIGYLMSNHIFI